jgi:Phage integrase, N-terminal SAM-like domain
MGDGQPRLLDQVRDRIRRKHYSIRTEQAYVDWIRRFVLHHNKRHPRDMGAAEVEGFLTHLAVAKGVSASTQTRPRARSCSAAGASAGRAGLTADGWTHRLGRALLAAIALGLLGYGLSADNS